MGGCCSSESDAHTEISTANVPPLAPHGRVTQVARKPPAESSRPQTQPVNTGAHTSSQGKNRNLNLSAGDSQTANSRSLPQDSVFLRKAELGLPVLILLSSGIGIEATMRVDMAASEIRLSRDDLKRCIPFAEVAGVLSSREELDRIKTEAQLDDCCSALLQKKDSTCFIFSFDTPADNQAFVAAALHIVAAAKNS